MFRNRQRCRKNYRGRCFLEAPGTPTIEKQSRPHGTSQLVLWGFELANDVFSATFGKLGSDKLHCRPCFVEKIHGALYHKQPRMAVPRLENFLIEAASLQRRFGPHRVSVVIPLRLRRPFQMNDGSIPLKLRFTGSSHLALERFFRVGPVGQPIERAPVTQANRRILFFDDQPLHLSLDMEYRPLRGPPRGSGLLAPEAASKNNTCRFRQYGDVLTEVPARDFQNSRLAGAGTPVRTTSRVECVEALHSQCGDKISPFTSDSNPLNDEVKNEPARS